MLHLNWLLVIVKLFSLVILKAEDYSVIVTDLHYTDCVKGKQSSFLGFDKNKFPYCMSYSEYDPDGDFFCDPTPVCPPALYCYEGTCYPNKTSCFIYYANIPYINDDIDVLEWKPTCLDDGNWALKQCKENSRCFCYDSMGKRLFGEASMTSASDMTCACSRRRSDLEKLSGTDKRFYVTFHCDSKGNYEPLQCDSGHCWCVESISGELRSLVVPESAKTLLQCYADSNKANSYGSQYLRKCESSDYAKKLLSYTLQLRGTHLELSPEVCQYDGSYGPYAIKSGQVFCVTKFKGDMSYHVPKPDTPVIDIDCNCARDQAEGRNQALDCDPNGNYKPIQGTEDPHCYDRDGFKKKKIKKGDANTDKTNLCSVTFETNQPPTFG